MSDQAPSRLRRRLVPPVIETASGMSMYAGAAAAVSLFPLFVPAAIEFLGPVAVAALGSRRPRDLFSLGLAVVGVVLVADVHVVAAPLGVALALLAGALWAGYVVMGKHVATAGRPAESMAVGFTVAVVALAPIGLLVWRDWEPETPLARVLILGLVLGVASSVVPYGLDQVVLRTAGRAYFAVLLALLPVSAVVAGALFLGQTPTAVEAAGIALVVVAVALRTDG